MNREITKNYSGITKNYMKLKEGQSFKNYKDLCNFLDIPIKQGNPKVYQIKEFDRYFEYERKGHKYVITCVYEEPITKYSRSVLANYVESLILDMLVEEMKDGNEYILLSKNQVYNAFAFTNNNYNQYKHTKEPHSSQKVQQLLNVSSSDIEYFYTNTTAKFNSILNTALNDLKNKFIIKYVKPIVLCVGTYDSQYSKIIEANEYETNLISKCEESTSEDMGYSSARDFHKRNQMHILRNTATDKYNEFMIQAGISFVANASTYYDYLEYYYEGYKIMFTDSIVKESKKMNRYVLDNKDEIERLLNSKMVTKLKDGYSNVNRKHIGYLNEGKFDGNDHKTVYKRHLSQEKASDTFVNNGHKLVDYGVNRDKT